MKKFGFFATIMLLVLSISGCGSASNNLSGTKDMYDAEYGAYGYENTYGYNMYDTYGYDPYGYDAYVDYGADLYHSYVDGGAAYWDGYGINEGRTISSDTGYSSYTTKSLLN